MASSIALASCGHSQVSSGAAAPTTTGVSATTTTATATGGNFPVFRAVRSWRWTFKDANDYTQSGTFEVGVPMRSSSAPTMNGFLTVDQAMTACGANPQTDVVVPFDLKLINTTSGFDNTVSVLLAQWTAPAEVNDLLSYQPGFPKAPTLTMASYLGGQPTCTPLAQNADGGGGWSMQSDSPLTPQNFIQTDGYIIISNYYSPAFPNGNIELWNNATLGVGPPTPMTSFTGPGLTPDSKSNNAGDETARALDLAGHRIVCTVDNRTIAPVSTCNLN